MTAAKKKRAKVAKRPKKVKKGTRARAPRVKARTSRAAETLRLVTVNYAVLDLVRASSFNAFSGPDVADALDGHRRLWDALWWDMEGAEDPFMKVLDPCRGDTLYLRARPGQQQALRDLLRSLKADVIRTREHAKHVVISAWWD